MARIPFPVGLEQVEDLPKFRKSLTNCFNNGAGQIVSRPGIEEIADTGGVARGQFVWQGELYQVVSEELIKITDTTTGAFSVIGSISGSAIIETAIGFNDAVIVVKGGSIYTVGNPNTLASIGSVSDVSGVANFNYSGGALTTATIIDISGFITNTAYNIQGTVTNVEDAIASASITGVTDNGGIVSFTHAGTSPTLGAEATTAGFVTNTSYNATGIVTATSPTAFEIGSISFDATAITSVTDNGGVAVFNFPPGPTLSIGQQVIISSFTTNTAYNGSVTITAAGAGTFETGVAFGTDETGSFGIDESTGKYTALASFRISSISFGSDESTGSFAELLVDISNNANFVPSVDVAHIDGRFVYIPADGDPAFFSDVGAAGSVQGLSFFDAEELPDKNNSVFNFKNTLYIGGTDSFELFRDTGASPNPFQRVSGARITNGFIGGLIEYDNTFLFIGRKTNQDFGIFAIGQGEAPKISNEAIDLILSTYTTTELSNAVGGRFIWRGYDIATFSLARDSFGFLNGNWFILNSAVGGDITQWGAGFINQLDGVYFTAFSNKIGKLAKINTDYGEKIARVIDVGFQQEDNKWFSAQSLEIGISQGFNSSVGSVALFLSRNNVEYGPAVYRKLGVFANYDQKLVWNEPGGLGSYDGFFGIRLYTTEDVIFNSEWLSITFRG